jgi:hypothetical protein
MGSSSGGVSAGSKAAGGQLRALLYDALAGSAAEGKEIQYSL